MRAILGPAHGRMLDIDNGATERANRDIALGRGD